MIRLFPRFELIVLFGICFKLSGTKPFFCRHYIEVSGDANLESILLQMCQDCKAGQMSMVTTIVDWCT